MRALLPAKEEVADVIQDLSTLAAQANVKIETIFPQQRPPSELDPKSKGSPPTPTGPAVYEKIMVQIDALAGYHHLGSFLNLVESGPRPMRVSSLRIAGNPREPKRHFIKLLIQAYFATSDS
jgi:Tfp pilus assembly protein PilO